MYRTLVLSGERLRAYVRRLPQEIGLRRHRFLLQTARLFNVQTFCNSGVMPDLHAAYL